MLIPIVSIIFLIFFIFAIILYVIPKYRIFGIIYLIIYAILVMSFIIYIILKSYGQYSTIFLYSALIMIIFMMCIYLVCVSFNIEFFENANNCYNKKTISSGPCITDNKEWGLIFPKYGNKCVSMSSLKYNIPLQKSKNMKVGRTDGEIDDEFNKYNSSGGKAGTKCELIGADMNGICKREYGQRYYAAVPYKVCECPYTDSGLCEKKRMMATCVCKKPADTDINGKYTGCRPMDTDFDNECQKFGHNYGYVDIYREEGGCCPKGQWMAKCSQLAKSGLRIDAKMPECIATDNAKKHLEKCRLEYPNDNIIGVKDIDDYNCNVGYYSSKCIAK